ncbi:ABC transporter ATP-binding protein [Paracidovorax citrulli]
MPQSEHHRDIGGPAQPLVIARDLVKHFPLKGGMPSLPWLAKTGGTVVRAVDGISFDVLKGETLGVVGESGCGKSTTARLLMQLLRQDTGELIFDAQGVGSPQLPMKRFRSQVQMVFQDSYSSLNPRLTIEQSIAFTPRVHGVPAREAVERARYLLSRVGLEPARFAGRYPHELSGGQRQRVNIARALVLRPRLVILDEAVSALDKSVEAQVLNLLMDLKAEFDLTYVFISHDLNVVRYLCDRVMVMYLGKVVEIGDTETIYRNPAHPYTRALLASMPSMDPERRTETAPLAGDPPNPIDPPSGCPFHPRCAFAEPVCSRRVPTLTDAVAGHPVACLMADPAGGHSRSVAEGRVAIPTVPTTSTASAQSSLAQEVCS